jgi:hypothetical protein
MIFKILLKNISELIIKVHKKFNNSFNLPLIKIIWANLFGFHPKRVKILWLWYLLFLKILLVRMKMAKYKIKESNL